MTIPASNIVSSLSGVLSAGGSAIDLNGLFLTNNTRAPIGAVLQFPNAAAVQTYFGAGSAEAAFAAVYFAGPDISTIKPGNILFTQFNTTPVSAYLRGGNASAALTLTQLQAISGTLSAVIDGVTKSGTPNLSGATSFTNAAQIINQALGIVGSTVGTFTGSIATTTLTVTTTPTSPIGAGMVLSGAGVTANTFIVAQLTGTTGGQGTYQISTSQTTASTTITAANPAVTYDSIAGAFVIGSSSTGSTSSLAYATGAIAATLLLTQATGAVLSQGAAIAIPASFMTTLANSFRNWASFGLTFNPDGSGNAIRLAFAAWAAQQSNRYIFVAADTDVSPTVSNQATSSLGYLVTTLGYGGVSINWQPSETYIAALVMGYIASINFNAQGGRMTLNGRTQSGFVSGVVDATVAANLQSNGYNFYGAYATANQNFNWYVNGSVSGSFAWADSMANSIWLTNNFQVNMMTLMQNMGAIPYNTVGKGAIEQGLSDTIQKGLTFGAYAAGVTLAGTQKAAVTAAAGQDISGTLSTQGWYLFVGDASPQVRQKRGSPPCTFFYMDGEAVQQLAINSIVLL
jgi:hypothetical protein